MPTHTITQSSSWRSLEEELLRQITTIKGENPLKPVTVLTGSRSSGSYLRSQLTDRLGAVAGIRFLTFRDILSALQPYLPLWFPGGPLGSSQVAIVQTAFSSAGDYFGEVTRKRGFQRALLRAMNDLDEAGIQALPPHLAAETYGERRKKEVRALIKLRDEYLRITAAHNPAPNKSGEVSSVVHSLLNGADRMCMYGLYDFNAQQRAALELLAPHTNLDVLIPSWKPDYDYGSAFNYTGRGLKFLKKLLQVESPRISEPEGSEPPVTRLFNYAPATDVKSPIASAPLEVIAAPGVRAEVQALVNRINRLALFEKVPLHRIAVVLWSPEEYHEPLKGALREAGLPCCDLIGTRLTSLPAARTLLELVKLAGGRLKRRSFVDLLAEPQLKTSADDAMEIDHSAWESLTLSLGIVEADHTSWLSALDRQIERRSEDGKTVQQVKALRDLMARLSPKLEKLARIKQWRVWLAQVCELLEEFLIDDGQTARLKEVLQQLLKGADAAVDEPMEIYPDLLESILAEVRLDRTVFNLSGVALCDKMSVRAHRFKAVLIAGLTSNAAPLRAKENPLLPDDIGGRISELVYGSTEEFSNRETRVSEERLLFALAVAAADRVILSYPYWSPSEGRAKSPSWFITEFYRALSGQFVTLEGLESVECFNRVDETGLPILGGQAEVAQWACFSGRLLERALVREFSSDLRREALSRFRNSDLAGQHIRKYLDAKLNPNRFSEWDGNLQDASFRFPFADEGIAVTRLESYANCPFRFFMEHILQARQWEEPELLEEIPPHIIGTVVHRTLEQLFKEIGGKIIGDEERLAEAGERLPIILKHCLERERARLTAPDLLWRMAYWSLEQRLRRFLEEILQESAGWTFSQGEVKIAGELPDVRFANGQPLRFTGQIDRIDVNGTNGVRLIDYKTGRQVTDPKNCVKNRALQLPIYLMYKKPNSSAEGWQTTSAAYWQMTHDGCLKPYTLSSATLDELYPELKQLLEMVAAGLESGFFAPNPSNSRCQRCPHLTTCSELSRNKAKTAAVDSLIENLLEGRGAK